MHDQTILFRLFNKRNTGAIVKQVKSCEQDLSKLYFAQLLLMNEMNIAQSLSTNWPLTVTKRQQYMAYPNISLVWMCL